MALAPHSAPSTIARNPMFIIRFSRTGVKPFHRKQQRFCLSFWIYLILSLHFTQNIFHGAILRAQNNSA
jgi:hypothetical protein